MELFLLRHGDAVTQAERDSDRPLSALGKKQVRDVFSERGKALAGLTSIMVSPYLRAQQTYMEAQPFLPNVEKLNSDILVPCANPYAVIDLVYAKCTCEAVSSLLLISHQPLLGSLLDLFCGFEIGANPIGTSTLAAIDMEIPGVAMGKLRWIKHP